MEVGRRLGIDDSVFRGSVLSSADWLFDCGQRLPGIHFDQLLCFIWGIWFCRNDVIHNEHRWSVEAVVLKIESLRRQSECKWLASELADVMISPETDQTTCYCDGSWSYTSREAGWASVFTHDNLITLVRAGWLSSVVCAVDAEGEALRKGMDAARQHNLLKVRFVSDCSSIVWSLFSGDAGVNSHKSWWIACVNFLDENPGWSIGFVPRDRNRLADELCKRARRELWSWWDDKAIPWMKAF